MSKTFEVYAEVVIETHSMDEITLEELIQESIEGIIDPDAKYIAHVIDINVKEIA